MTIDEIKKYVSFRGAVWPDGKDALDFAITEMGEAVDAWLRKYKPRYLRNHDKDSDIGLELADAYQMLEIASHELTGKSLDENLREKWKLKGYIFDNSVNPVGDWHDKIRGGSNNFTTESDWNKDIFIT